MAQTSLLMDVIEGATAVGGGDLTVVSEVELVVLLEVESVTIGSAIALDKAMTKSTAVAIFLFILFPKVLLLWDNKSLYNYLGRFTSYFYFADLRFPFRWF